MNTKSNTSQYTALFAIMIVVLGSFPAWSAQAIRRDPYHDSIAQTQAISNENSIAKILSPDGTINRSALVNGTFDPKGYRMEFTSTGAPRFVPDVEPGDEYWDPKYGRNGVDFWVFSIAIIGGDVYVGGSTCCSSQALRVSKWNGGSWTRIGEGVDGSIFNTMAAVGTDLYVGGFFSQVSGVNANNLAKWNGSSWSSVGGGTNHAVLNMTSSGTDLYVGGSFTVVGFVSANGIAKWNGTTWTAFGQGITDYVHSISVSGSDIYVGGQYPLPRLDGYVRKWNGTTWVDLPGPIDRAVDAVRIVGSDVYVGGRFSSVQGIPGTSMIAKWNGSSWSALGAGLMTSVGEGGVKNIRAIGSDIWVSGSFNAAGGNPADSLAKWNGSSWSAPVPGAAALNYAMEVSGTNLYLGGRFGLLGNDTMNGVGRFNTTGSGWSPLREGFNEAILTVAAIGNDIFVGGAFTTAYGVPGTFGIARWNGTNWLSVAGGVDGAVNAMAVNGNSLWVGGTFTFRIRQWIVGSSGWIIPAETPNGTVNAIGINGPGTDVYVGGNFTSVGGIPGTAFVAMLQDNSWSSLGAGVNQFVSAIVVTQNLSGPYDVYVGGGFSTAGGVPGTNRVARWNGSSWWALGTGANNQVLALALDESGNVYAGGAFTSAGGVANTNHIAKWNGTTWSALGTGINGNVWSISVSGNLVQVGGLFTNSGGVATNNIAKWNGNTWEALGSGTNSIVRAVFKRGRSTYVGGTFSFAGNKQSYFFGRYMIPGTTPFDFDGDAKSDVSIFRPSVGEWWLLRSSDGGNSGTQFGAGSDKIAAADFTGDGKTDLAFWRPSTGEWFVVRSENMSYYSFPFGMNGDVPVPADYDGDGRSDPAVFRPSDSTWYINRSSGGTSSVQFGTTGDRPIPADYDGDGRVDIAVFRPLGANSQWWLLRSTAGVLGATFGASTDRIVSGDYTGDGKADMALWRPSTGFWFIVRSEDFSFYGFPFGASSDIPAPGDYDGDARFDAAVFRPAGAGWFINRSSGGTTSLSFGTSTDIPLESAYVP